MSAFKIAAACVALLAATPAVAEEIPPPVVVSTTVTLDPQATDPHKLDLSYRLMNVVGMKKLLQNMRDSLLPAMLEQSLKDHPEVPADARRAMIEAVSEALGAREDAMLEKFAHIYAATFTTEELEQTLAYYESPVGRSVIAKTQVLMTQVGPIAAEMQVGLNDDLMTRFCAKGDFCKGSKALKKYLPKK
jgi:hypothetical protein